MKTVTIVGVGLIGGSFALALRRAGFGGRILGVSSPRTVEEAVRLGVIDEARPLAEGIAESDLVYLSQPISRILETLDELDAHLRLGALATDAGSAKSAIVARARHAIRRGVFLGGHPMAGKESRGVAAAEPGLFEGRPYVVTPLDESDLDRGPVREFLGWIDRIGARRMVMDPERHDRLVALVSHLPQLASTALAAALAERPERDALASIAGPGAIDMTRLALSPHEIWADIIATNQQAVGEALDAYIEKLREFRTALWPDKLEEEFRRAGGLAARLRGPLP